jgi:hypothetical protein
MTGRQSGQHFASAIPNAKPLRAIVSLVRRARVDYEAFRRLCAQVTERDSANLRQHRQTRQHSSIGRATHLWTKKAQPSRI